MWYTRTTCPLHMKWELDPEAQLPGTAILSEFALKGYSGVNLIHKTAPAPERSSFPTVNLCSFRNLRKDRNNNTLQSMPPARNRHQKSTHSTVQMGSQHSSRHQTSASFAGSLLTRQHNSPLSCSSLVIVGNPCKLITECSRVPQLKDENVWILLHGNAIKVHGCLPVYNNYWEKKNRIKHFLRHLVID